jgi:Carboxypeptidase regulatory-like domain
MRRLSSRMQTLTVVIIMLFASVFLNPGIAFAQATNTGTVVGVVSDQTGAVVAGTKVTLVNAATGTTLTTTTNGAGEYVFVNAAPGTYSISAEKSGFSVAKITNQLVSVGTQTNANFKLSVGSNTVTVEVNATAGADLQTLNATIGTTVSPEAINALPSLGRDVSTFVTLQPGVSPDGNVAGTVVDQATFQLDGGNNSSDMDGSMNVYTGSFAGNPTGVTAIGGGSTGVMPMPADSVEEMKSNTTNQTADFNNSSGAQVEVVTKRGTNNVHGTIYEYYLDSHFGANTWDNNLSGIARPSYHYNRFGAAAGGPVIPFNFLGGRTYLFGNYEGFRYPNSKTYRRAVPSDAMRNGILNYNNVTYNLKTLDPRGIGIDPTVATLWKNYEPEGNDPSCATLSSSYCDKVNEIGFAANVTVPLKSNFGVARLDHDFGSKWHFMTSYRYYNLTEVGTQQVDIGGFFNGDKLGTPVALAGRPQQPWYLVSQLTTNITSTFTNDFHYSYLRNLWAWTDRNGPPQFSGFGGALEPFGETGTGVLAPYNVDTQDIRTRFWDGHDHFLRDDVTKLKGNHLIQFGGQYQHNFNYHQRTDNGGGINYTPTYQLGDSAGAGLIKLTGLLNEGFPTSKNAGRAAAAVLGMVTDSQIAYTRAGNSLTLNAPLTPAEDKVTIPFYNVYFSDTWHIKPTLTVNYGLGWTLEMPPTEATGKQVALVDGSDEPVETLDYLAQRKLAAAQGAVYNPEVGFALTGNVGSGLKYPYNPFYGSFSPRISAAWNPHFTTDTFMGRVFGGDATVIRGGYGRVYGRLNGVDLVLVPLLGAGLIQPVQCRLALATGACGPTTPNDTTAFRIGVDGNTAPLAAASPTLPQPLYPGYNGISTATGSVLDPHFRPNDVDSFNLTLQRQIGPKMIVEVGYIGRLIHHEFQPININAVPYMMNLGGQSFANAYAAIETAFGCATSAAKCNALAGPTFVSPQPFFETALKGTGYCTGYASCTAAVANQEFSNLVTQSVWSIWSDLDSGGFNFPRSMMNTPIPGQLNGSNGQISSGVDLSTATGYGNYNAGFITFKTSGWHGLTAQENFTYSKTLGTGAFVQATSEYTPNDPFNLSATYGVQPFNRKYVFNTFLVWQTPWYHEQAGLIGRIAGGWTIAPIFTAGSGAPLYCNTQTDAQSFGGGDGANFFDNEQCVFTSPYTGGNSTHTNISGGTDSYGNQVGNATAGSGSAAINMFKNPVAVYDQVRAPILGIDTKNPGLGPIIGLPYWNMDMSIQKNIKVFESVGFTFTSVFTNIFGHNVFADTGLTLSDPTSWGVISAQGNTPRQIQLGLRANF